jgi:hypothetical protein
MNNKKQEKTTINFYLITLEDERCLYSNDLKHWKLATDIEHAKRLAKSRIACLCDVKFNLLREDVHAAHFEPI